jgi:hypothetical protein
MIDREAVILDLKAKEAANRKEYDAARTRHLHAIAAETNASMSASRALAKLQETLLRADPEAMDAVFRMYQLAEFTARETRDIRLSIGAEMAALSKANVYTTALSAIKDIRHAAYRLRELGIEPVSMLNEYGSYSESNPYGLSK